jgi:hypothetical protein
LLYDFVTPASYAPNAEFSIPMANLFGTTNANYDFVIQFKFKNGQMGTLQYVQTNVPNSGTTYGIASSNSVRNAVAVPIASQGVSSSEIVPIVDAVLGLSGNMRVYVRDPVIASSMSNFAGITVEYSSENPINYLSVTKTVTQLQKVFGGTWPDSYYVDIPLSTTLVKYYQIIVTLMYYSSGQPTLCTTARKYSGNFDVRSNIDQLSKLTMASSTSYAVLKADNGQATVVIPGLPAGANVIIPSALNAYVPVGNTVYASETIKLPTYQISFNSSSIAGFTKLRVYRKNTTQTQWEYTDLTTSGNFRFPCLYAQVLGNGARTINPNATVEMYLQVWTATASTWVTKVNLNSVSQQGTFVSVLGTTDYIDLTQSSNSTLFAALTSAERAFLITVQYNLNQLVFGDPNTATGNFN